MFPEPKKLPRGQFKCFQCQKLYLMREGNWYRWDKMEVHLCTTCERTTRETPARK